MEKDLDTDMLDYEAFKRLQINGPDNVWKPKIIDCPKFPTQQLAETEHIMKTIRGILNKLAPDNLTKMINETKTLISTLSENRLKTIAHLIFEVAVDHQFFSAVYAQFCVALSTDSDEGHELHKSQIDFRILILSKCQDEFVNGNYDIVREKWDKIIREQKDPIKIEQLQFISIYEEMVARRRVVGIIQLISELYKVNMFTTCEIMEIIHNLLKKSDIVSLECLCTLLDTTGSHLQLTAKKEHKIKNEFNNIFITMESLIKNKETDNRIRFLMMNIVDQSKNEWKPRNNKIYPKTKAEIHEEMKQEAECVENMVFRSRRRRKPRNCQQ